TAGEALIGPLPKSLVPQNAPVTHTSPERSTARAPGLSLAVPPHRLAQRVEPLAAESLAITMSSRPAALRLMPPKSAPDDEMIAPRNTSLFPSTATAQPRSSAVPPKRLAQTRLGGLAVSYLATNPSAFTEPPVVSVVPPKSTSPVNWPVTIMLPCLSNATLWKISDRVLPKRLAQRARPCASYLAIKPSLSNTALLEIGTVPKSTVPDKTPTMTTLPNWSTASPLARAFPLVPAEDWRTH